MPDEPAVEPVVTPDVTNPLSDDRVGTLGTEGFGGEVDPTLMPEMVFNPPPGIATNPEDRDLDDGVDGHEPAQVDPAKETTPDAAK